MTSNDSGILLICHAEPSLGLGHLSRMLALAWALREAGMPRLRLLILGEGESLGELTCFPHRVVSSGGNAAQEVRNEIDSFSPRALVLDLHPGLLDDSWQGVFKYSSERSIRLIGVDSLRFSHTSLDLVWVPSFFVDSRTIRECGAKLIFGWDSYLIRKRLPDREWTRGRRVLVLTGGSDASGQGASLPGLLDRQLPLDAEVHWVRGPFSGAPAVPDKPRLSWVVHDAPQGLDELIVKSSYVLAVFGVSLFESMQYGMPCVAFSPYGAKDNDELAALRAAAACDVASDPQDAVERMASLMLDDEAAGRYARDSARLLSASGAKHLAEHIRTLIEN